MHKTQLYGPHSARDLLFGGIEGLFTQLHGRSIWGLAIQTSARVMYTFSEGLGSRRADLCVRDGDMGASREYPWRIPPLTTMRFMDLEDGVRILSEVFDERWLGCWELQIFTVRLGLIFQVLIPWFNFLAFAKHQTDNEGCDFQKNV